MKGWENAAKAGLLVTLDALFDTRLATLDALDPLLAAHALKNNYLDREEDNFKYCPLELFKEVYAKRDAVILGKSRMTQIKDIVIEFMNDGIKQLKSQKTNSRVNVYINVWPYKISKDAAGELLRPFYDAVNGQANIHLVNMSFQELTPEVCKNNFSYIITYDYIEWLLFLGQTGEIQNNPMREVTVIAPRLYLSGKPTDINLEDELRSKMEPHQCAEFFFAPYVNIEFYITRLFSASLDQSFIDKYLENIAKAQKNLVDKNA